MGFRFRKSVNLGPLRVNFSKSGIGYSVGGKGFRATKKAGGGFRTTASIPGTGISYVRDYSTSGKKKSSGKASSPSPSGPTNQTPPPSGGKKRRKWPYVVAAVLVVGMIGSCVQNDDTDQASGGGFTSQVSSSISTSEPEAPAITSLSLDCDQTIELDVKDTQSIPVLVLEEGADATDVEFTSSDPNVLTFTPQDDNGTLVGVATPKAEGTAEISVSAGDVKSQIVTVTVIDSERIAAEEAAKKAAEEEAARKAAEEAAAQQAAQQPQEEMVWIPQSGSKYHSKSTCSGMNNPTQVPISTAKARGYEACKRCY